MKDKIICIVFVLLFLISLSAIACAEEYDISNMSLNELETLKAEIETEIDQNHRITADDITEIDKVAKQYIEEQYGEENVSWAWLDYKYGKEWNFFTYKTHAEIKKDDIRRQSCDIYMEIYRENNTCTVVYADVDSEIICNARDEIITDIRIRNLIGLKDKGEYDNEENQSMTDSITEPESNEPEEPLAKKGDCTDITLQMQKLLFRTGYLKTTPDGVFGDNTLAALKSFQGAKGFEENGILTESVLEALQEESLNCVYPKQIVSIKADQLYNAFNSNVVAAEKMYVDEVLLVKGKVQSIQKNASDNYEVDLIGDKWSTTVVRCYFDKEDEGLLFSLRSGQEVSIQGICTGENLLYVGLKDCELKVQDE